MIGGQPGRVTSPVMVGREAELERIEGVLASVPDGRAPLIVISGEAGIGKTRLIDRSLAGVADHIRVLRTECLALGSRIPYLPFAEILRSLTYQVPMHTLKSIIGSAAEELVRLLPELEAATGTRADREALRVRRGWDELDRLRLYESFLQVAERIARDQPTVFVIEDLQWIDHASLELLAFLAHGRRQESPSTVIVSMRPEQVEQRDTVLQLLADLGRMGATERIELRPLSFDSTRRLVSAIVGDQAPADLTSRIHELSDGNPLFAEELLAAASGGVDGAGLPPKLRDLLSARLAALPAEVLAVLRVASAAGRSIDEQLLSSVGGLDQDHVQRAVRVAVDEHILVWTAGPTPAYRFRHEVMRSLVASRLLPAEAALIHAGFAEALAGQPRERQHATEIADHWDAAGDTERALVAHLAAAERASETFAFGSARDHYERALELWDVVHTPEALTGWTRVAIMDRAAATTARVGDFERAIELTRAVVSQRQGIDVETLELARSSLRWYLWESGDIAGGLAEARAVVDDPAPIPARWRANALAHLAGLLLYDRQAVQAGELAEQARDAAAAAGAIEEQVLAEGVLGWCLLLEGDVEAGLDAIRRVVETTNTIDGGALEGRYPVGPALASAHLAGALELVGRFHEARDVAIAGAEIAARQGVARTFGSSLRAIAARALYQLGRWDEAESVTIEAIEEGAVGHGRIGLLAVRAMIAIGRGDDDTAQRSLEDGDLRIDAATSLDVRRWLAAAHAERAIWDGRPADALGHLAILADDPEAGGIATPSGPPAILDASIPQLLALGARACSGLALQERAAGATDGLAALVDRQLRAALDRVRRRKTLASAWAGDLALARAELERAEGDARSLVRRWRAAAEAVSGRPYAAAYAGLRLAEAELALRDGRERAAPFIERALAVAASLGARPLSTELESLARRARLAVTMEAEGPIVSPSADRRPFGLTTRELEVLALLADGMGNQEIAEQLYISPKTASVHVSNIYSKLGVESRVAAATTAHSLGLAGTPADPRDADR